MEEIEEAPVIENHLINKSGYLVKFAKLKENAKKLKNFRNRFFVLNANAFTYYGSHKSLSMAKGNVLLIAGSTVENMDVENFEFSFRLTTPFETLVMAAKSAEDRESWKVEIERAINYAQYALRGYMIKKGKSFLEGSPRKFFVFWNNILSFHADHEHTAMTQWAIEFSMDTAVLADDSKLMIKVSDSLESVRIQFEKRNAEDYPVWKEALLGTADKFNEIKAEEIAAVEKVLEEAIMNGQLQLRPETGGDDWPEYLVALTESALVIIEQVNDEEHFKIIEEYILRPECNVKQTLLKTCSFQFATAHEILHFATESPEQNDFWLESLSDAIKNCSPAPDADNSSEVLYRESLAKIMQDVFYDVHFSEKKPLGMVLERVGEWAIVKISNYEESGVKEGSVLSAINNVAVVTSPYEEIVSQLQEWEPPLTLTFRQAPEKVGYLTKMVNVSKENPKWKSRFFILSEGKLAYKKENSSDSHIRDGLPLTGAVISLIPAGDFPDRFYCFQVLSGVKTFIMEAADVDEWREWTAMIYHAISVANGAAYILEYEFEKYREEEERLKALEEFQREKYDEAYNALVQKIYSAIEDKNMEDLERLLDEAIAGGMEEERSVQYAIKVLQTFRMEQQQREEDEKLYIQAFLAKQEDEEKNLRLEKEFMELQEKVGLDEFDVEDDDDIDQEVPSSMSVATIFGSVSSSIVATVSSPGLPTSSSSTSAVSTTAIYQQKRRMSIGNTRRGSVIDLVEDDNEVDEDVPIEGTMQDEKTFLHIAPATVEDLKSLFHKYAKSSSDGAYINVMQFSAVFRLVTGHKGNLYNEMKMFNKFDATGKGFMTENDFVQGWMTEAIERNNDDHLKKDTLNQRWKNDKSGFGFKMLQKMGWKEDKGLGKNETGIVSSVKIKKREASIGLGMEKEVDLAGNAGWSETVNSYNDVLAILKSTYSKKEKDPEKKRKTTKSFTVGIKYKRIKESKDLSTKSSADMRAILGTTTTVTSNSSYSTSTISTSSVQLVSLPSESTSGIEEVQEKKSKKDKKHRKKSHSATEIES